MNKNFVQHNSVLEKIGSHNGLNLIFDKGFQIDKDTTLPFYDFNKIIYEQNWSTELENLHEEASFIHPVDYYERKLVIDFLSPFIENKLDLAICDFGCSTGFMLRDIKDINKNSILLGVDVVESGLIKLNKKSPDIMLFKYDITNIPFPDNLLDVVICLNVLEHIEEDSKSIEEFSRVLKASTGVACIVVPYGDTLYDYYDSSCMHVRRYAKHELITKLKASNFEILRHGFINPLLFMPFYIKKKMNRILFKNISSNQGLNKVGDDINFTKENSLISGLFKLDYELSKRIPFPFGIREIVLVKKL